MLKKFVRALFILTSLVILLLVASVGRINDTGLQKLDEVQHTYEKVDQLVPKYSSGAGTLVAGWTSRNITPKSPIHMAGYGRRGPYESVMDSLYAKAIVMNNGEMEIAIISLDLLMFPRKVKSMLYDTLLQYGFSKEEIFLTATHTHNGFGNWEESAAGRLIFGNYDAVNTHYLTNQIVAAVLEAKNSTSPIQIGFQKIDAGDLVYNRLAGDDGRVDPFLRVIYMKNSENQIGVMASYSGHAVNLDADIWTLSRDFPGVLTDQLEESGKIAFAMFCAGMVGSHNIKLTTPKGPERINKAGQVLSRKILQSCDSVDYREDVSTLAAVDLKIEMPPSQLRLTPSLRLRDWVFRLLMDPLQADIKLIEVGDILLIGMPCDYSGELAVNNQLDERARSLGKSLFITSFNGNYIGYITEDQHYYSYSHDEVMAMNWVGPNKGKYFTEILKKLISATAR